MGKTTEKISDEMKSQLLSLYNEGKMDTEIARELGVTRSAIYYWRKKLCLKSKFDYSKVSKIDDKTLRSLVNRGLSDYEIADLVNMSTDGIYNRRIRHGILRDTLKENKSIPLTQTQIEVLVGTVMGDSYLRRDSLNTKLICVHCPKQKDYIYLKHNIFTSIGSSVRHSCRKTPNKKTGKLYSSYVFTTVNNPTLNYFREKFYPEEKKIIPMDIIERYFTAQSLAYMFMDDGFKMKSGYAIATNCFSIENLQEFIDFLKNRFGLSVSIFKSHVLYIKTSSKDLFTSLVSPYVIDCMKYKLHTVS